MFLRGYVREGEEEDGPKEEGRERRRRRRSLYNGFTISMRKCSALIIAKVAR